MGEEASKKIDNPDVVTKYRSASTISDKALKQVLASCTAGKTIHSLCLLGDEIVTTSCKTIFKDATKGIAMPTCVSVNHFVCHVSPTNAQEGCYVLKEGDVVKVELGTHVDGYCAFVAGTCVVGGQASGPKANVILAAHNALEAAIRMIKPGNSSAQVSEIIDKVSQSYGCTPVQGILSHQIEQNVIAGAKSIMVNPTENQRKSHQESKFESLEVYHVDVVVSSGQGKVKPSELKTGVFKLTENTYMLKVKASRAFYSEVNKQIGVLPFSLRQVQDETKARMGLSECLKNGVMEAFDVLEEKEEESFVAQFACTLLLMPAGPLRITCAPFDAGVYKSDSVLSEELKTLIEQPLRPLKKKN